MRCNYKKRTVAKETIMEFKDHEHFNELGARLTVGEYYPDFINNPDATILSMNYDYLAIIQALYQPTPVEIENFKYGAVKFALAEDNNILFFLSKFGTNNWNSSTTNFSLSIDSSELKDNQSVFPMVLFDTSNGKLLAIRFLSVEKSFIKEVNTGIRKQLLTPFPYTEFSRLVNSTYKKYPSDDDLLKDAFYFYSPAENAA